MQQGWTVLFFVYAADNETKLFEDLLIDSLKTVRNSENLTLLVFESLLSHTAGGMITAKLFNMQFDPAINQRQMRLEHNFEEVNPGDKTVLKSVLKHIRNGGLLREKFLLFTWDHGTGFGIFDGDPTGADADMRRFMPQPGIAGTSTNSGISVIGNHRTHKLFNLPDNQHGHLENELENGEIDMLTFSEINEALKTLEMKTELVIMLNCWMQMLENSFEVADTVEWLVAAETVHFFAGYDYVQIINCMADDPHVSGKEVARVAIETLPGVFQSSPRFQENLREVIVTAVKPGESPAVVNALNAVCNSLKTKIPGHFDAMVLARESCKDLSSGYFLNEHGETDFSTLIHCLDLLNYVAEMVKQRIIPQQDLINLQLAIDAYKQFEFIGDNFSAINQGTGLPFGYGVSIFHPNKPDDFSEVVFYDYFYRGKRIKLAKTQWGEFLEAYKKNR
jgi:hypothetical protein